MLWSQMLHTRTDLSELRDAAPALADRLDALGTALNRLEADLPDDNGVLAPSPSAAGTNRSWQSEERGRVAREFDRLVDHIRTTFPGFSHFLAPTPCHELLRTAEDGPVVVINVSRHRCDALILTPNGVHTVALPNLSIDSAVNAAIDLLSAVRSWQPAAQATLRRTLAWMWDTIAHPVLDAIMELPQPRGQLPRVWWCPTGSLTLLPLHAAGHYGAESIAGATVLDRVISSYTPTISALLRARATTPPEEPPRVLAVGMPETPGQPPLKFAETEVTALVLRLPTVTPLIGPQATRAAVLDHLHTHNWVHLACHGSRDPLRPESGDIQLYDGPLTVLQLAEQQLTGVDLAFLAACRSADPGIWLADESIHLAAAMQLAGFRRVVATLWSIVDDFSPDVSDRFYERLTRSPGADSPQALHYAVLELRKENPDYPRVWAPYVHIGP